MNAPALGLRLRVVRLDVVVCNCKAHLVSLRV